MEPNTTLFRTDIMSGKKVLYVHGFASSGASGTVKGLRILMPQATIVAPDLPVHPAEAMDLLHSICREEHPDLIIGASMGGMYAEMLYGYDRILVNPAFGMADTMAAHNMMGRIEFRNPRLDGLKDFLVNKALLTEYREVGAGSFAGANDSAEQQRVHALYGVHDETVHTYDLFMQHYTQGIRFEGAHFLNDRALVHALMPLVQRIDDKQEGRQRPIMYIALDETLRTQTVHGTCEPRASAVKAFHKLSQIYSTYVLATAPYNEPQLWAERLQWVERNLGVPAYNRIIMTAHKDLCYGDYLIDALESDGATDFMGTRIKFGEDPYKTWDDVLLFFERLGGQ